jgi:hypothetical protein
MKKRLTGLVFCLSLIAAGQEGTQWGASVSTGLQLNTHHSKTTTLWSFQPGYGFAAGGALKNWRSEYSAINTGLEYEYAAFDSWNNNYLVSSTRYHSLHIPLTYHYNIVSTWYATFGTGINYLIRSRIFTPANSVSIASSSNPFQPYLSIGVATFSARGTGHFELGMQARYHVLDLWKKSYPTYDVTTSKLLSVDLLMRFYF